MDQKYVAPIMDKLTYDYSAQISEAYISITSDSEVEAIGRYMCVLVHIRYMNLTGECIICKRA